MEPVRRRWKPLQTLTFSESERQMGSVSCKKASLRPRSQTLENARTAGICGVDGGVYAPGPFSCFSFVSGKSALRRSSRPVQSPRCIPAIRAEYAAVGLEICSYIPAQHYCDFPYEHWTRIRTNNVIERLNREIRRRTRVVGTFPDGNSALMLVCARLRHVAGTQWGNKKYMNMKHLETVFEDASIAG